MTRVLYFLLTAALAFAAASVNVPGGKISVDFDKSARTASEADVLAFVARSAKPVSAYYGKFPVPRLRVSVQANERSETGLFGREFHGEKIIFFLGAKASSARMRNDQILTHEMFHLGFPDLSRQHAWIEEGLATYLAHLTRARVGHTTEEEFWADVRDGFRDALASKGFAKEEEYHLFYWGGALLWFEIDLEIRRHSKGHRSLDTVTRAILREGGTNARRWGLARLQRAVDRAAGFAVFDKWYRALANQPAKVNLEQHWQELGVQFSGERKAQFQDQAPLSGTRRSLLRNLKPES